MILIPLVIIALFWLPPIGFKIIVLVICMLAAWEWAQFAGFKQTGPRVWVAVLFGLLLSLMIFSLPSYQSDIYQPPVALSLWVSLSWWTVALVLVLFYPASASLWRQSRFLRLAFGALTLVPFFWGMVALRQYHYNSDHFAGAWWLLFVMLLVWGADSGAYMFGKLFGRHKLAPKVSPGKTWEGFAGGLISSAVMISSNPPLGTPWGSSNDDSPEEFSFQGFQTLLAKEAQLSITPPGIPMMNCSVLTSLIFSTATSRKSHSIPLIY